MIDCRDCRERLNDLLEDDFASNEASTRADLRAHVENCADCRAELEFLRAIRADLRSFGVVEAPADLRAQVRSQLISEKPLTAKNKAPFFSLQFPRLALSGGAVLAACCLLLIVRSAQFQGTFSMPSGEKREDQSAPSTFAVPDSAFGETPAEKTERLGGENKAKSAKKKPAASPAQTREQSKAKDSRLASPPMVQNPTKRSEVDKEGNEQTLSTEASRPVPNPETEVPTLLAKADKPAKLNHTPQATTPVASANEGAIVGKGKADNLAGANGNVPRQRIICKMTVAKSRLRRKHRHFVLSHLNPHLPLVSCIVLAPMPLLVQEQKEIRETKAMRNPHLRRCPQRPNRKSLPPYRPMRLI